MIHCLKCHYQNEVPQHFYLLDTLVLFIFYTSSVGKTYKVLYESQVLGPS